MGYIADIDTLTITDGVFSDLSAKDGGSAWYIGGIRDLTVTDSTFSCVPPGEYSLATIKS